MSAASSNATGLRTDFDIAVVGGGPVGVATAALLAKYSGIAPARLALIAPELAGPGISGTALASGAAIATGAPDLRVAALSRASEQVLRNAGAWTYLAQDRICAYQRMRVWHESVPSDGPEVLVFNAAELAEANLGFIIENRQLAAAGLASFKQQGGQVLAARVTRVDTDQGAVRIVAGADVTARLVVGADGAQSRVRELLRLPVSAHEYGQSAIVATVATAKPHQHTAWQRFLRSGPLALLPLFDGSCSIVWSAERALAEELMTLTPGEFATRLDAASDRVLGTTKLLSERWAVPLRRATANRLIGPRVALVGDAAHVIHPLAGQGVNLGFLDAAALGAVVAAGVAAGEDPGAARLLLQYEQQRLTHNALMSGSMSVFNQVFSRGPGPAGWVAARLLGLAGISGTLRRGCARLALGLSGELPSLARKNLAPTSSLGA